MEAKFQELQPYLDCILQDQLKLFTYWIKQRYDIFLKKQYYKEQKPWTNDELMSTPHYTNVRRLHDRVTRYLLKHVCYNQQLSLIQKIANIMIFRIYNKPQTFDLFGFPFKQDLFKNMKPQETLEYFEKLNTAENFSLNRSVYYTSGVTKRYNEKQLQMAKTPYYMPFYRIWTAYHEGIIHQIQQIALNGTGQELMDAFLKVFGVGAFLGYQMYVDLCYCPQIKNITENDVVYLGSGAQLGVAFLTNYKYGVSGLPPKYRKLFIKYVQYMIDEWLYKYQGITLNQMMVDLPEQYRWLSLANIQNCFCEFSKFRRFKDKRKLNERFFIKHRYGRQPVNYDSQWERFFQKNKIPVFLK